MRTKWQQINIKMKLIIGFSTSSLVGLSVLGGLSLHFASKVVTEEVNTNLRNRIDAVETTIKLSYDENVHRKEMQIEQWSQDLIPKLQYKLPLLSMEVVNQVTQAKTTVSLPTLFYEGRVVEDHVIVDHLSKITSDAVTLFINSPQGLVRVSTSVTKADGTRALGTMIPTDSAVYKSLSEGKRYVGRAKVLDKWFISAYEPIMENRKLVGAFFMGTPDISYLKIKESLKEQKILDTGYFFIIDGKGEFILHPSREGEQSLASTDLDGQKIFQEIIEKKRGKIEYRWLNAATKSPQDKLAIFRYVPEFDWYVSASVNTEEVQAPLQTLKSAIFIITALAVLGMIVISYLFGTHISNHLQETSKKLQEITHQATTSASDLSKSSSELSSVSTESAASLEETVASLEEITSQVKNNSKVSEETSQIGQATLITARQSKDQMNALLLSMQQIQSDSKRIQEMSELIDDIAFQTNLLALNAAVEAARAGEHGRGFAVVADAVRNLALKSADSAKQISGLITESNTRVDTGVHAVKKADQSFKEIVENIEKLSSLITQITEASAEQSLGLSQINQAMNQMDQTVQLNATSAEDLSRSSSSLSEQSEHLTEAVIELTDLINGQKKETLKIAA